MPKEQLKAIYNNTNAYGDILADIQSNGEILKEVTGKDVTSISWPYGYYTTHSIMRLKVSLVIRFHSVRCTV